MKYNDRSILFWVGEPAKMLAHSCITGHSSCPCWLPARYVSVTSPRLVKVKRRVAPYLETS